MKTLRKVLKFILYIFVLTVGYIVLLINFGENETRISCDGEWHKAFGRVVTRAETIDVSIFQYAWFVPRSSDGYAIIEILGGYSRYIDEIEVFGSHGEIAFDRAGGMKSGSYSTLKRSLFLIGRYDRYKGEVFVGKC